MKPGTTTLIRDIERAFASAEYPGDDKLALKSYGDEPEALVREFRGRRDWRTLDAAFLNQAPEGWGTALSFFTDEAFAFYLPAYLICDLRGELDIPSPAWRLCTSVTPQGERARLAEIWGGGTMGDRAREGFALFAPEQVTVIVAYLCHKLDAEGYEDPTISQALEYHWLERAAEARRR